MLSENLSRRVLTVGCAYRRPRGNIILTIVSYTKIL